MRNLLFVESVVKNLQRQQILSNTYKYILIRMNKEKFLAVKLVDVIKSISINAI